MEKRPISNTSKFAPPNFWSAFFFLCFFPSLLSAQSKIKIENLNIGDGLSHRLVLDILQDRQGFLWLATYYGLNRYDGTEFIVFKNDPQDPEAFHSGDNFSALAEDKEGHLWIGTLTGEVIVFDPLLNTHQLFEYEPPDTATRQSSCIATIYISPKNVVWVVRADEMFVDPANQRLERYMGNGRFEVMLPASQWDQRIKHLQADDKGNLWLLGQDGYYYFDTDKRQLQPRKTKMGGPLSVIDGQNRIWFPSPVHHKMQSVELPKNAATDGWIHFVYDNQNNIWLKNREGKVYKCDTHAGEVKEYGHFPIYPDNIFKIYEDAAGIIWTSESNGGVNKILKNKELFDVYLNATAGLDGVKKDDISISSIAVLPGGPVFTNNSKGVLFEIDPLEKEVREAVMTPSDSSSAPISGTPKTIYICGGDSLLWLATSNMGLVRYDPENGQYTSIQNKYVPSLLKTIVLDGQGNILGNGPDGIFIFNSKTGQSQWHKGAIKKLLHPYFQKDKNTIWGTVNGGVAKIDVEEKRDTTIVFFPEEKVAKRAIYCITSHQGFIWAGTFNGLVQLNPGNYEFTLYTVAHGLPNNAVNSIVPDGDHLWLGTYDGLSRFDLKTKAFKNYSMADGLSHPQFNGGAATKGKNGEVYLGCKNGLIAFHPNDLEQGQMSEPKLVWIKFSKYAAAKDSIVELPMHQLDTHKPVVLHHGDKTATFRFALFPLLDPSKNKYAYILEGYEPDWNYVGNVNFITYNHIPPGNYVLKTKAADAFGNWVTEPLAIPITVKEAWYKRWWAIAAYILLAISGIWLVLRFQLNRKLDKQEAQRLKELDTVKTKLYTNITHEFRTPLTVILGTAEQLAVGSKQLAAREEVKEDFEKKADTISRNGQNLLNLVNQMLDLSKLESGKLSIHLVLADMVSYVKYIASSFHSYAAMKDIELNFHSDMETGLMDFDRDKILNIVSNLLSNAIKFTPEGGEVEVSLSTSDLTNFQNLSNLTLTVKDTGIGIPAEQLHHIFDRFYQVDDSTTRKGEGTGIGLTLVKELVNLMGGKISVQSKEGEGTEFTVALPVTNHAPLADVEIDKSPLRGHAVMPTKTAPAVQTQIGELPILLIVEDNADVAQYIQSCLENEYQIIHAADGQIGIDRAIETIPDIIISDVMMPNKDGFELVQALKNDERTSHIPIVLLTAKADVASKIEGLERGADAYLAKPFNQKELQVRLGKLIELRKNLQKRYLVGSPPSAVSAPSADSTALNLEDQFLQKAEKAVLEHLDDSDFGVPQLCRQMGMSQSQLYRKLKALTNKSIAAYIRQVRLHEGRKMLQSTNGSISEVAYQTGFSSLQYFSDAFFEEFGYRPSELSK